MTIDAAWSELTTATMNNDNASNASLLLILQLPIYRSSGALFIDRQAHNGLHRWLDNFENVTVCMPAVDSAAPADVIAFDMADFDNRCQIVCMPGVRSALGFSRAAPATIRVLDALIDQHTHLSFALGGLFGDWAAVAGLRASHKHRRFSVWTDRVESQVIGFHADGSRGIRKIYWTATALAMKHYERFVIRRASLGLFHGADCYAAYARFSCNPHLVHDIHLTAADRIPVGELTAKLGREPAPLRIIYAGRAHAEKGVFDWIETLSILKSQGVAYTAVWYGDGPELRAARQAVSSARLDHAVAFPGALHDRRELLSQLRAADVFLFCHKTPESPRCLIEALISGTPIVGYASAYPQDLIAKHNGGLLTQSTPERLAVAVSDLVSDRRRLSSLTAAAAADGHGFNDTEVFRHRSDLIKAAA